MPDFLTTTILPTGAVAGPQAFVSTIVLPPGGDGTQAVTARAIVSQTSVTGPPGPTGPTGPDGAPGAPGGIGPPLATVAATATVSGALVVGRHNPLSCASGGLIFTLPTGAGAGTQLSVERTDTAAANTCIITGNIHGVATQSVTVPAPTVTATSRETLTFLADTAGSWWPIAGLTNSYLTALAAQTGYLFTINDSNGYVAIGMQTNGGVVIPLLQLPTASVDFAQLSAALAGSVFAPSPVQSGWVVQFTTADGHVLFGVKSDGTFAAKGLFPLRDTASATYRAATYRDTSGLTQLRSTRRSDGAILYDTAGQAWNSAEPSLDPSDIILFKSDQSGTLLGMAVPAAGGTPYPVLPQTQTIDMWGDSLTAGVGSTTQSTDTVIAKVTSTLGLARGNNYGIAGQTSTDIAARSDAVPALLTVTSNQIPAAATAVTVTAMTDRLLTSPAHSTADSRTGTLAGVPGTLNKDTSDVYTFTRTTAGSAVACPAATPWHSDLALAAALDTVIIWSGRNDGCTTTAAQNLVLANIAAMVAYLKTYQKRFVVLSVLTGANSGAGSEYTGTAIHDGMVLVNTQLAALYGGNYIDVRRYLIDHGLADAGVTPTSQDLADVAGDTVPASLRADGIHLMTPGYGIVAAQVVANLRTRKWYP